FFSRIIFRSGILIDTLSSLGGTFVLPKNTLIVLSKSPVLPFRSTVTPTWPLVCGGRCHGSLGSLAAVQLQDVLTWSITTSESEMLVKQKENSAIDSLGLAMICG